MSDYPNFVNPNYTSFAKKEEYKPPVNSFFNTKPTTKRQKHIPGGEWAQDNAGEEQPHKSLDAPKQEQKGEQTTPTERKSKFGFIKKAKKEEASTQDTGVNQLPASGTLDFSEVRKDA
jgi:hypothetical protein